MRPRAADSRPYERAVQTLAPIRQLLCKKENLPRPCQMGIPACCAATCTTFPAPGPSRRTAGGRMVSAPAPHFCRAGAHSMRPRAADSRPYERAVRRLARIRQLLCEKENLPHPRQMGISACCAAICTAFPAPGPSRRTADGRMVSAPTPHFCHVGAHSMRPNLCLMALASRFLPNLRGKRRRAGRFPAGLCRRYHSRLPAGRSRFARPAPSASGGGWISCEAGCAPSRSPALSCLWFLPNLRGKRRRAGRFPAGLCRRYHSRLPAGRSALCAPCAFGFGGGWISCEAGCAPSRSPALSCLWFLPTSGAKDAGPAGFRPARCIP